MDIRNNDCEKFSRNKYNLYIERALEQNYRYIASIFQSNTEDDLFSLKNEANDVLISGIPENSNVEVPLQEELNYKEFEEIARNEGFLDIADFFHSLAKNKREYNETFQLISEILNGKNSL